MTGINAINANITLVKLSKRFERVVSWKYILKFRIPRRTKGTKIVVKVAAGNL